MSCFLSNDLTDCPSPDLGIYHDDSTTGLSEKIYQYTTINDRSRIIKKFPKAQLRRTNKRRTGSKVGKISRSNTSVQENMDEEDKRIKQLEELYTNLAEENKRLTSEMEETMQAFRNLMEDFTALSRRHL